jgi:hypothetical protein
MQTVHIERELPTTADVAYNYFIQPELLMLWWPSEAETDPQVGGEYRMFWEAPGVTLRGQYRKAVPGRQLAFTSTRRGCVVSVTHDAGSDDEASDYTNGWIHFLGRLQNALSHT